MKLSGIGVSLGGREVLRDVNLTVAPGTFMGLVGPNGAGKTTLLRAAMGLVPHSGRAELGGRVGYVPQRHEVAWDFPLTIADCVRSGRVGLRTPRRRTAEIVAHCLQRVRLGDLATRPIGELSGGQRQRVLVARALAGEPQVLLLDEPFTGVDVPSAELLLELFATLAAEGHTVVMSTHDLGEAMDACDAVTLLNRTVIASGPPASLTDPQLWMTAFGVSASSPLLRTVGLR